MIRYIHALTIFFTYASAVCANSDRPNVVLILADDLGYGDLACYGASDIATPNIDRLAAEGAKFDSFYVSAVCSPTRASLMTGSHSIRVGIGGVLFPRNNIGINPDEITLPEILKTQGYATAIIGKWHLGNEDIFSANENMGLIAGSVHPHPTVNSIIHPSRITRRTVFFLAGTPAPTSLKGKPPHARWFETT